MSRRNLHEDFDSDDVENRSANLPAGSAKRIVGPQQWMCSQQGVFDFEGADSVLEELQAELVAQLEQVGGQCAKDDRQHGGQHGSQHGAALLGANNPAPLPAAEGTLTAAVALQAVRGGSSGMQPSSPVLRQRLRVLEVVRHASESTLRVVDEATVGH